MNRYLLPIVISILLFGIPGFCEETLEKDIDTQEGYLSDIGSDVQSEQDLIKQKENNSVVEVGIGWAWGDVIYVFGEDNAFRLQYLDLDSKEEKNIKLFVDSKTVFENAEDLTQIKIGDSLSVDYVVTENDEKIARLITKENKVQNE